jgi:hypothetical protein
MKNKTLLIGALLVGGAFLIISKKKTAKTNTGNNALIKKGIAQDIAYAGDLQVLKKVSANTFTNTTDPATNPNGYKPGDRVSFRRGLALHEGIITKISGTEVTLNTISEGEIKIAITAIKGKK